MTAQHWRWLLLVVLVLAGLTACEDRRDGHVVRERGGEHADYGLNAWVDSSRHVACYNHVYSDPVSCVALDSTNSHAVGR